MVGSGGTGAAAARGTGGTGGASGGTGGASGGTGGASDGTGGTSGGTGGTSGAGGGAAGGGGAGVGGSTAGTGGGGGIGGTGGTGGTTPGHGPSITSRASGSLDVFGVSASGVVFQKQYAGGAWGTSISINSTSTAIASDIDVAALDSTRLEAFGLGTNKEIYELLTISQTWPGWSSFTPGLTFMHGTAASVPSEGLLFGVCDRRGCGAVGPVPQRRANGAHGTTWEGTAAHHRIRRRARPEPGLSSAGAIASST